MESLSNVTPPRQKIEIAGREIFLSSFTLETLCWVEENYGSFDKFQTEVLSKPESNLTGIINFIYELVDNKDDFGDLRGFRRLIPVSEIWKFFDAVSKVLEVSLPKGSGGDGKKK